MTQQLVALAALALLASACVDKSAPPPAPAPLTQLRTDRTYVRDEQGRYVFFHGVNVSCATKIGPLTNASGQETYIGRPFPLETARENFERLRAMGFDSIRLLVLWEAIEPTARGVYDEEYLDYLRELVRLAGEYGLYVLVDFHQDIFSRHLKVKFNSHPAVGAAGSLENSMLSMVKPFDDQVQGDGAPRWAVEACLQEKNLDSKFWGTPRITSGLTQDELRNIYDVFQKLSTGQLLSGGAADAGADAGTPDAGPLPDWVYQFAAGLPDAFPANESTDMLPFTNWAMTHALSLDVARSYACFFAGDKVFPGLTKNGVNVKDYLQDAYAASAAKVAAKLAGLPNVMGYDLMNEPSGNYVVLVALAGLMKGGAPGAEAPLVALFGPDNGKQLLRALVALRLLPPDTSPETLRLWGLDKIDVTAALGLNSGFDDNYMRPFYERVGQAILEKDPRAVMFIESAASASSLFGGGPGGGLVPGLWEQPMKRPQGLDQLVFAPHYYPDIYPYLGFNVAPRNFTPEQVRFRDYEPSLRNAAALASYSLGNPPVVFGEFGTYFNLNGIKDARKAGYDVSSYILNNYHEAFERMFQSNLLWCYSPENDFVKGDGWNREDFSVLDKNLASRGELSWARPHARALAGKPLSTHFYSDYHYFDPDKGVAPPAREFEVRYASRESSAPTELVVPKAQYPDGFYVWVSDGLVHFDAQRSVLYHAPASDEPGAEHWVRLRPPIPGSVNDGWQYFIKGDQVMARGVRP
jgi:hypothetical protein